MTALPLDRETILRRMNGIQQELGELEQLAKIPLEEFTSGVGFKLAQYHLHRALEGVFHIAGHLLSRIPGGQATEYKEIARKIGEYGIISQEFANSRLTAMAGYRNRLVHFYAEVTPTEMHRILGENLQDFDVFLAGVKQALEHPDKFGIAL